MTTGLGALLLVANFIPTLLHHSSNFRFGCFFFHLALHVRFLFLLTSQILTTYQKRNRNR